MRKFLRILTFMKPYWWAAILPPILLIVVVRMTLLIPKTMGDIINLAGDDKMSEVIHLGLMMLLYTLIIVVFTFFSNFFSNYASASMVNDIRIATFKKALNMSYKSLDNFEIGKVITRVTSDTNMLRWMTGATLRTVFRAPYLLIGSIIMIIGISPRLAYILLASVPLLFLTNYFIVKKSYPKYRVVQEKLENVNTFTHENLENIRVVKAFNRIDYENNRFDQHINELTDETISANTISAFNTPIFTFIMNLCTLAVLAIAGLDVMGGKYDTGNITAFILYLGQISGALAMINRIINILPRAGASSHRILELLDTNSEIEEVEYPQDETTSYPITDEIKGTIEFNHVWFSYKEGTPVLKDVSFKVSPGEKLGIIGTTGSGKTSLINLIPRYYDVEKGSVLIDGIDVRYYDVKNLRRQISTIMQRALLFAGTIGDNIKFGKMEADEEEVYYAAENAEATEFINKLSNNYDTILGERGINLSGGQKQRLSMSRSILTKPKILIFDDSTSAVDMKTEMKILSALNKNIDDTSIIIIAQRIRSIINADKIIVLEDGKITGFGTHNELLKSNKIYKDIYDTQIGGEDDE